MALTSWANASLFNLLVVLATVTHLLLPNVLLPVPDVHLTACRSLAFQERPVGRSVIPLPSSGLSDLTTCYLDTENNIIFGPLHVVFSSHSGNAFVSPGQHQALLRFNTLCSVLVHLPEQPRGLTDLHPPVSAFLILPPTISALVACYLIYLDNGHYAQDGSIPRGPCSSISPDFVLAVYNWRQPPYTLAFHQIQPGQRLTWILDIGPQRFRPSI